MNDSVEKKVLCNKVNIRRGMFSTVMAIFGWCMGIITSGLVFIEIEGSNVLAGIAMFVMLIVSFVIGLFGLILRNQKE